MPETKYTVTFQDGTELRDLTFEEAGQKVKDSEGTDNEWRGVFIQPTTYKTP